MAEEKKAKVATLHKDLIAGGSRGKSSPTLFCENCKKKRFNECCCMKKPKEN